MRTQVILLCHVGPLTSLLFVLPKPVEDSRLFGGHVHIDECVVLGLDQWISVLVERMI